MPTRQWFGFGVNVFRPEWVAAIYVVATLGFLALAAWSDVAIRVIPDCACIGVAVAGLAHRAMAGVEAAVVSLGVALVVFALLVVAHARGVIGGGDVKLAAAALLGFSPPGAVRFLMAVALVGGGVAMVHLVLRRVPPRWLVLPAGGMIIRRVMAAEAWRVRRRGSLPYGVAIAGGGAWVVLTGFGG